MTYILRIMLCGLFVLPSLSYSQPLTEQELRLEVYKHVTYPCFEVLFEAMKTDQHRFGMTFAEFMQKDETHYRIQENIDRHVQSMKHLSHHPSLDMSKSDHRNKAFTFLRARCITNIISLYSNR